MFCKKCGNQMPDGSKFCTKCGAAMGAGASPAVPVAGSSGEPESPTRAEGTSAGDSAAPKKKRTGLVIGIAIAAAVVLAAVGIAVANPFATPAPEPAPAPAPESIEAPQAAPDPEPQVESTPEPEAAPEVPATEPTTALPEGWFGAYNGDGFSIVDENGLAVALSNPDTELVTPFAGGFSLGSWETSEYDAEWDTVHDQANHYALFDSSGNAAVDLDAAVAAAGITGRSRAYHSGAFSDGRMVVALSPEEEGQESATLVLDEQGSVVFSLGRQDDYVHADTVDADAYHDGVIPVSSPADGRYLADVDGNVLVGEKSVGEVPVSLGYGWYAKLRSLDKAFAYDGSVAFDPGTLNGDGVIDAKLAYDQPGGSGIVAVQAQRENPYGGANKDLAGLYSIPAATWLVPLGEELDAYGQANGDVLWARTAQAADAGAVEAAAEESPGARAPSVEPELHSALVDAEGNVVFDASMAPASLSIPEDFCAQYLHDGWWGIRDDGSSEPYALVLIADGKFVGCIDAPQNLASYPNSGIFWL